MNFENQPKFVFSSVINVYRDDEDSTWIGFDEDGLEISLDEDEMQNALHIGAGLYALIDPLRKDDVRRFYLNDETGNVHIEDGGSHLSLEEFIGMSVRVDDEGRPIVPMCASLHTQYIACKEGQHTDHLHNLSAMARHIHEKYPNNFDSSMYFLVSADIDDGLTTEMALQRMENKTPPSYESLGLSAVIDGPWSEIIDYPQYLHAPVRSLFGRFLGDRIGEFPIEKIARMHVAHDTPLEDILGASAELIRVDQPFDGSDIVPGYRTSEVSCFRGDNFDAIVFSDMMGKYVYAWPTPPTLDNEPQTQRM